MKWVLRFLGLCVLFVVIAVVGAYVFQDEIEAISSEARAFASQADDLACLDRAMSELAACDGVRCSMSRYVFARECLRVAKPSPALCELVPDSALEAGLWSRDACPSPDVPSDVCARVMREVAKSCVAGAR